MKLKADANKKMEAWLQEKMSGQEEEGKLPYVESTSTIDKVHELGGHTGDIIGPGDIDTINRLQRDLKNLNDREWNGINGSETKCC